MCSSIVACQQANEKNMEMVLEDSVWLNSWQGTHQGQCKFEGVSWKPYAFQRGVLAFSVSPSCLNHKVLPPLQLRSRVSPFIRSWEWYHPYQEAETEMGSARESSSTIVFYERSSSPCMGTWANSYGLKETTPSIVLAFSRPVCFLLPALFDYKNIPRLWGIQTP